MLFPDPAKKQVVVGDDRELFRNRFLVREVNSIRPLAEGDAVDAQVKIRHNHQGGAARVESRAGSEAFGEFAEPQRPSPRARQRYFMTEMKWWAVAGFPKFSEDYKAPITRHFPRTTIDGVTADARCSAAHQNLFPMKPQC